MFWLPFMPISSGLRDVFAGGAEPDDQPRSVKPRWITGPMLTLDPGMAGLSRQVASISHSTVVTGQVLDSAATSGTDDDLVEPGRVQPPTPTLALEHHEHAIGRCGVQPLQVAVQRPIKGVLLFRNVT